MESYGTWPSLGGLASTQRNLKRTAMQKENTQRTPIKMGGKQQTDEHKEELQNLKVKLSLPSDV